MKLSPENEIFFQKINSQVVASFPAAKDEHINFFDLCSHNQFCLKEIASQLNVTGLVVRERFKKFSGMTPKAWIREQRVLKAIRMIKEDIPIDVVMESLYYHDYPHISKDIKYITGMTPKQMRKEVNARQTEKMLSS